MCCDGIFDFPLKCTLLNLNLLPKIDDSAQGLFSVLFRRLSAVRHCQVFINDNSELQSINILFKSV